MPDENELDETTELIFFGDRMTACHSIGPKNGAGTQNIHVDSGGAIPWAKCYAGFRERVLNVVPKEQLGKAKKLVPADERAFRSVSGEPVYLSAAERRSSVNCGEKSARCFANWRGRTSAE